MPRLVRRAAVLLALASAAQAQRPTDVATYDPSKLTGLHYRMIGPARGGRVTAVTGVPQQPSTFYFGSTGGGVWKTTDAGLTWRSTGDQAFASASIGALDVADSDPNIVYVGTGSEAIRSNVSIGKGIYKSADAGRTWRFVGLRDAGQIGAIVVHPTNPDIVFAAVVGNPFANSPTRGVYRTRDGGSTWQRVLFLSDSTGAVDIELQPGSPDVIYASMWHGMRRPWTIISGGAEDGIYRSRDGGDHWVRLGGGLPTGVFGKSDLAVSAAAPDRVYALVEAKPGSGLYRSDDAGESWALVNSTPGMITRPFYYDNVDADPTNADVVYAGAENFYKSIDGGHTFRTMRTPHGDNHDMWINPTNGQLFIQSNDGGANVTRNGGVSWSTQQNQPTAEIYQVAVDDQYPYRVYGAQQDQGSTLIVPSLPVSSLALDEPIQSWRQGPGCETGPVAPNRTNPDTVYGACKGQFSRMSLRSGQERQSWIGAQSLYGNPNQDLRYRFQRVSPMEVSPHAPHTVYFGSQFVHRTRDEGITWETISPDLTANDPRYRATVSGEPVTIDVTGEEMYATLYAIRESPVKAGVIWAGANDGPISVTRDDGRTWTRVTPNDLPPGGRVQNIEPSPHRAGAATSPCSGTSSGTSSRTSTRPRTTAPRGRGSRRDATASPPTHRHVSCVRIPTGPACCMPAPSSACTSPSTTAHTGTPSSSTSRSRRLPTSSCIARTWCCPHRGAPSGSSMTSRRCISSTTPSPRQLCTFSRHARRSATTIARASAATKATEGLTTLRRSIHRQAP
jgi:photosystem II stability/assembly factor-like uncharacterized protein